MKITDDKIEGNESAFPITLTRDTLEYQSGLTIRQQFAHGNMVALVSTFRGSYTITEKLASDLAKESLMLADALIKELNNSEDEKGS